MLPGVKQQNCCPDGRLACMLLFVGAALIIACIYGTLPQGVADNGMPESSI
jgi:hypothetical protein